MQTKEVDETPEDDKDYTVDSAKYEIKVQNLVKQFNLKQTNEMQSPRSGAIYKGYID